MTFGEASRHRRAEKLWKARRKFCSLTNVPIMNFMPQYAVVLALLAFSFFTFGCSTKKPDGVRLSGVVTLDGEPLEKGSIDFYQEQIDQSFSSVIRNGKYETFAKPGEMTVRITAFRQAGTKPRNDFPGDTAEDPVLESIVPEQYNEKTTLKCLAGPGGGPQNFDLLSKP